MLKNVLLGWFMGHQFQKVDCVCVIRVLAKSRKKSFLCSLAKLGNCYNWRIRRKSSLDLDVIWTRNVLIWSQTCYHYSAKSGNSLLLLLLLLLMWISVKEGFLPVEFLKYRPQISTLLTVATQLPGADVWRWELLLHKFPHEFN